MKKKYLLYIDILGFSDLVKNKPRSVQKLFKAMDKLNVHEHPDFKTIVFSDTILIFNKEAPSDNFESEYIVMYCCEFVQDLQKWCSKLHIQFRAILLYGEFSYLKQKNLESYYGNALIDAYRQEKEINAIGLFISKEISRHNRYFDSSTFNDKFDFVFLLQSFKDVMTKTKGSLPIPRGLIDESQDFPFIALDVRTLANIKRNISLHNEEKIKTKYLTTYQLYKRKYPNIVKILEKYNFCMSSINSEVNWEEVTTDNWKIDGLR